MIAKFDAIGLSSSLLATIKGELGKALERSTESEDLFRHSMAFAQIGTVTNRTRELTVPIRYSYTDHGQPVKGALQLRVRTWSVSSQFVFDPVAAKFTAPLASTYINNTSVIINGKRITVFDFLKENGEDNVRSFIKALQSPEGYKQADIFSQCSALLTSYRKYLSNRDATALMWATISEFRFDFKRSNGAACIEGRKAEFGIRTADHRADRIPGNHPPKSAAPQIPGGRRRCRFPHPGDSAIDRQRKRVSRLVPWTGSSALRSAEE